jgi:hypothetical protein
MKLKSIVLVISIINAVAFSGSYAMEARCTEDRIVIRKCSNRSLSTPKPLAAKISKPRPKTPRIPEHKDSFVQGLNELMCDKPPRKILRRCIEGKKNLDIKQKKYNIHLLDEEDRYGMTPLIAAIRLDEPDYAKTLLKKSAAVNYTTRNGNTPLKEACRQGNVAMVKLLLCSNRFWNGGIDVNYADSLGVTALHEALNVIAEAGEFGRESAIRAIEPIVDCLRVRDADWGIASKTYGTAFEQAVRLGILKPDA